MKNLRYKATLAYEGTGYEGFQVQPHKVTIQGELERVLEKLYRSPVRVHCSGRTDAGVHARGQVIHFDAPDARIPRPQLHHALNCLLPADIRVHRLVRAPDDFHARFSATGKEYRYHTWRGSVLPPFLRNLRNHYYGPLDVPAMQQAAMALKGEHDFAAFAVNPGYDIGSTVRIISRFDVLQKGHELEFRVAGNGFLYKMVRSLAGCVLKIGRGEIGPESIPGLIAAGARHNEIPTAPAKGLVLWRVDY